MATLRPASKISARPQIKAVKQPIPRQVILPKKQKMVIERPENLPPVMPRPAIMPMGQPVQQLPRVPNQPQYPTNAGFDAYGFDSGLVDYLNNQKQRSYIDAGISYNYDPATQTFTGGTMAGPVTMTLAEMQAQAQNYNPMGGGQFEAMPMSNGFGQPQMPMGVGMAGSMGVPQFNQQQYQPQPFGQPMMQQGLGAMPNYNQQGFVPMGGYDPQNTSNGSFGAIQQPMGGFGNIGSLLGKG